MPRAPRQVHHRFRVQQRVQVKAKDRNNKSFLFAELWRTVAEADNLAPAEKVLDGTRRDNRRKEYRLVEEWPAGAAERVIYTAHMPAPRR